MNNKSLYAMFLTQAGFLMLFVLAFCGGGPQSSPSPAKNEPTPVSQDEPSSLNRDSSSPKETEIPAASSEVLPWQNALSLVSQQLLSIQKDLSSIPELDIGVGSFKRLNGEDHELGTFIQALLPISLQQELLTRKQNGQLPPAPVFSVLNKRALEECIAEIAQQAQDAYNMSEQNQLGNLKGVDLLIIGDVTETSDYYQVIFTLQKLDTTEMLSSTRVMIQKDQTLADLLHSSEQPSEQPSAQSGSNMIEGNLHDTYLTTAVQAEYYMEMGNYLSNHRRYSEALGYYESAAELGYATFAFYFNLAYLYSLVGDYRAAMFYYDESLAIQPDSAAALSNKGVLYLDTKDFASALQLFQEAIKYDNQNPLFLTNLGSAHFGLEHYTEANQAWNQALQINPRFAITYIKRGAAQIMIQNYSEAIQDATTALELQPSLYQAYKIRGLAYLLSQNVQDALPDLKYYLQFYPNDEQIKKYVEMYDN